MSLLLRVLREPLVHFLILGGLLFVLAGAFGEDSQSEEENEIVVSEAKVLSLAQMWHRTWQRPPTQAELDGVIEDYVNEEVYYREALRLGLDRDDTIIRRRLRQKLEFVAEDLADAVEPTDEQLQQFLTEHADEFRPERRASFRHIYLNPEQRGDSLEEDANRLLAGLQTAEKATDPTQLGDRFLLPLEFENIGEREIASIFGPEFPLQLFELEAGNWQGPIESGYGWHLVLLGGKSDQAQAQLSEVRDAVRRRWFAVRREDSREQFYRALRERYKVTIRMPKTEDDGVEKSTAP